MIKAVLLTIAAFVTVHAQAAPGKGASPVTCSPAEVHPGDTLTVTTTQPFQYLAFKTPAKGVRMEQIVYPAPEDPSTVMMDGEAFSKKRSIGIDVAKAKFTRPGAKASTAAPIFDKAGMYTFLVSENMETDDGTPVYSCKVKYMPK